MGKRRFHDISTRNEPDPTHRPAPSFTFEESIHAFNLTYTNLYDDMQLHKLALETKPDFKAIEPSAHLQSYLSDYTVTYDRSGDGACSFALDLILCDCHLAEFLQRGGASQSTEDETPKPKSHIKVYSQVAFTHTINDLSNTSQRIVIGGHVSRAIGTTSITSQRRRRFHSLLLCVDAKLGGNLSDSFGQLVVFLASLRQSRISRQKVDCTVYGFVTDGFAFIFVTITHTGILQKSKQFDVMQGELPVILGSIRYLLEMAMSKSPNLFPSGELQSQLDDDVNFDVGTYLKI